MSVQSESSLLVAAFERYSCSTRLNTEKKAEAVVSDAISDWKPASEMRYADTKACEEGD